MSETVTILLATYNGEKYLQLQLDSLFSQTYTNWQLIIRDDVSTDNTADIIEQYKSKYPSQIKVLNNGGKNTGSVLNFGTLLQAASQARYIMFCDQDDEWMSDKIEVTYRQMQEKEKQYGVDSPLLIFTNFQYSDENLQIITSKENFNVNTWENVSFFHLLAQNPVYGCTTMINRSLTDKIGAIPAEAENHDYWIALIASFVGNIYYLNKKTVRYRQHRHNISGSFDNDSLHKRFKRIILQKGSFITLGKKKRMLVKLKELYYDMMDTATKKSLTDFLSLYQSNDPSLFYKNFKNGIVCQTQSQTVMLYTSLFFYKDELA